MHPNGHLDSCLFFLDKSQIQFLVYMRFIIKRDYTYFITQIKSNYFLCFIMQVLSNGRYKSVLHRAIVNNSTDRISVPTFYCPSADAVIEAPDSLVDREHPAIYRSYTFSEYYEKFWNRGLNSESCLDMFRNIHNEN